MATPSVLIAIVPPVERSGYIGLAGLEVWGQPAASCKKETLDEVKGRLQGWPPATPPGRPPEPPKPEVKSFRGSLLSGIVYLYDQLTCFSAQTIDPSWVDKLRLIPVQAMPAHFFDPITFEVMQDPVLLPSGKVVDRSTSTRLTFDDPPLPLNIDSACS